MAPGRLPCALRQYIPSGVTKGLTNTDNRRTLPLQLFSDSDAAPQIVRLAEMQPDQIGDCFVLLISRERGNTRDGKPYFRVTFRDGGRTASSMIWNDAAFFAECERDWKPGSFYKLRCRYSESNYGPQVEIDRIRAVTDADEADGFDPGEFHEASRFNVENDVRRTAGDCYRTCGQ